MSRIEKRDVIIPLLKPDCVLIDDDDLVQFSWRLSAKAACRSFIGFTRPEDFFNRSRQFDKTTPIFVDCNLGHGVSGEDIAKQIYEQGFEVIYISTGYSGRTFENLPFLKGVVGKDPVWISEAKELLIS